MREQFVEVPIPGIAELGLALGGDRLVRSGSRKILSTLGAGPEWVTEDLVTAHVGAVCAGPNRRAGLHHVRRWDGAAADPFDRGSRLSSAFLLGGAGHLSQFLAERVEWASSLGRPVTVIDHVGHFMFAKDPETFVTQVQNLVADL